MTTFPCYFTISSAKGCMVLFREVLKGVVVSWRLVAALLSPVLKGFDKLRLSFHCTDSGLLPGVNMATPNIFFGKNSRAVIWTRAGCMWRDTTYLHCPLPQKSPEDYILGCSKYRILLPGGRSDPFPTATGKASHPGRQREPGFRIRWRQRRSRYPEKSNLL